MSAPLKLTGRPAYNSVQIIASLRLASTLSIVQANCLPAPLNLVTADQHCPVFGCSREHTDEETLATVKLPADGSSHAETFMQCPPGPLCTSPDTREWDLDPPLSSRPMLLYILWGSDCSSFEPRSNHVMLSQAVVLMTHVAEAIPRRKGARTLDIRA